MNYLTFLYQLLVGPFLIKKNRALPLLLKTALISLFFYFSAPLCAEDVLEVTLSTENRLSPLYLSKVQVESSSLSTAYIDKLWQILHFDLSHSGYFALLAPEASKEKLLKENNFQAALKNDVAFYTIKLSLSKSSLKTQLLNKAKGSASNFNPLNLTGTVSKDRELIHQLSDAIVEKLTGKRGIASLKILYSIRTKHPTLPKQWLSEIWLSDSDGGNAKQLTFEHNYAVHPIFVPQQGKSNHFIYVSYLSGQPKLYYASLHQALKIPIVDLRGNQLLPSISQQGNFISFICDASGRPDLFIQRFKPHKGAIGQPLQLFSFPRATQASSTFSPNADKIAFVSDKDGSPRIYVCKLDESLKFRKRPEVRLLSKENAQNVTPVWSPDGKKLAYSAKSDSVRQIWIYDFEEDREWQLTKGSGNKENPFWAPDSLHLLFNTEDDYSSEIYLINLNQKESVKITSGPNQKRFPAWEPF